MSRPLRISLILLPSVVFAVFAAVYLLRAPAGTGSKIDATGKSKLVVVVVFDQMRGDYLARWWDEFGPDGFEKMKREGVWYRDAHLPYGCSSTGPGHASIGTGQPPSIHGIIENRWYNRATGQEDYCAGGDRPYRRIPERPDDSTPGFAPDRLLCEGLGDRLLNAEPSKSRVFSLSLKDRAAVLMGGRHPTGVYAFDTLKGEFHTSSYYAEQVPAWVNRFNRSGAADRWFGKNWDRLGEAARYDRAAGPDDVAAEGAGINGQGRTFPHPLSLGLPKANKKYYDALENSAHGSDLLWEFAQSCFDGERLGRNSTKDLLFLGFSSNDLIGHSWGPDSHEVFDITLRSDRLIADLIARLDRDVGAGNYTLIVTADHGVCPLPELAAKEQPDAARFNPKESLEGLGAMLEAKFGPVGATPEAWVSKIAYPDIYLNRPAMIANAKHIPDVEAAVAQWSAKRDSMLAAFSRTELAGPPLADPLARRIQLGFRADRSGDVVLVNKPYHLPLGKLSTGTSHGSPHDYDTHVPVLMFGAGVEARPAVAERSGSPIVGEQIVRSLGLAP